MRKGEGRALGERETSMWNRNINLLPSQKLLDPGSNPQLDYQGSNPQSFSPTNWVTTARANLSIHSFISGDSTNAVPHYHKLCSQVPTIGEITGVSTSRVQWIGLALGKLPSGSWYLPFQVSMSMRVFIFKCNFLLLYTYAVQVSKKLLNHINSPSIISTVTLKQLIQEITLVP